MQINTSQAAIDQALGNAPDLSAYHAACAGRPVCSILNTQNSGPTPIKIYGVLIVGPEGLNLLLDQLSAKGRG